MPTAPSLRFRHQRWRFLNGFVSVFAPYDNRDSPYMFRDTLLRLIGVDKLEYRRLISRGL